MYSKFVHPLNILSVIIRCGVSKLDKSKEVKDEQPSNKPTI